MGVSVYVCVCVFERGVEVGVVPFGGFLCEWRDLNTVIYFTSPKQIRQDISTQAED